MSRERWRTASAAALDDEIARLLLAGESYRTVLDALPVGSLRIAQVARARGIKTGLRRGERRRKIEALLRQGYGQAEAAHAVGVARQWAHQIAEDLATADLYRDLAEMVQAEAHAIETAAPIPLDAARATFARLYGADWPDMYAHSLEDLRYELTLAARREEGEHQRLYALAGILPFVAQRRR